MANYSFETIGAADALKYNGASDTLSFTTAGSSAGAIQVVYDSGSSRVAITSTVTGRTVLFNTFEGPTGFNFPDGSKAFIAHAVLSQSLTGTAGSDALFGGRGINDIQGGAGADTLVGAQEPDTMDGGPGADLFIIDRVDSQTLAARMPVESADDIYNWEAVDRISFSGLSVTASNYTEITAASDDEATAKANEIISQGVIDVVAVQRGNSVHVFVDHKNDNGQADSVVTLFSRSLSDLDVTQFVNTPVRPAFAVPPADPAPPAPPPSAASGASGMVWGNMDQVHLSSLLGAEIVEATPTYLEIDGASAVLKLGGTGFTYDANEQLTGGIATSLDFKTASGLTAYVQLPGISAAEFGQWVAADATQTAFATVFAGSDKLDGGLQTADLIRAYGGDDLISGRGGADTIWGGDGNDKIYALSGSEANQVAATNNSTYLRGEAGDDFIVGGAGFDDIHGNTGADTGSGGDGGDWVVGGKDDDKLFGEAGDDIVYGNLGVDECVGGDGADTVRGGQQDDVLLGGNGNDWLSGDRDNDTITGGSGADVFHSFGDAGLDRVTDFNRAEGDRVLLDPGSTYTVAQSGSDTVISIGGGAQVVLVGVSMSSLGGDWITVG